VRRIRLARSIGLALVLALMANACSRESHVAVRREPRPPMRTSTTIAEAGTFPVTVPGVEGPVTVGRKPKRIVALSPSITEVLYAIEAGDQVVGVDEASDRPGGTPVVPGLRGVRPAAELVARQRPDLVVVEDDEAPATLGALALQGVPVLEVAVPDTLEDSYAAIQALGQATGHPRRAGEVVDAMRRDIATLAARAATRPGRGAVYHELDDRLFTVTSLSFVGRIYQQLGFTNVGDEVESGEGYRYGQLSNEQLADEDPAWIVLAHAAGCDPLATLTARGWGGLGAVRDGHVGVIDGELARSWGPGAVELVRQILVVTRVLPRPPLRPDPDVKTSLRPACPEAATPPPPAPPTRTSTVRFRAA
jgi:iron complex transport system substrate-binding protein